MRGPSGTRDARAAAGVAKRAEKNEERKRKVAAAIRKRSDLINKNRVANGRRPYVIDDDTGQFKRGDDGAFIKQMNKGGLVSYFKTGGHVSPLEKAQRLHRKGKRFDEEQKLDDMDAIYRMMRSFENADIDSIPGLTDQTQMQEQIHRGKGFNKGGGVDSVPAMLTPGEFVVRKAAVDAVGVGALQNINRMGFNAGGMVPEYLQFGGFPEPAFAARGIGYGVTEPAFATRGGGQTAGVGIDSGVIVSAIQQLQSTVSTEIQDLTAAMTTQQGQQGQVDLSPITALNNTLTGLTQWEGFNVFSEAVKMLGGIGPFQVEVPGGINVNLGSFEAALISQISTIVTNAVRQALADQPKTPVADNNSADGKFNNNV
jgi:hypothetical protein